MIVNKAKCDLLFGFTHEQSEMYRTTIEHCMVNDISNDKKSQDESIKTMKMILNEENLDYFDKLDKINALIRNNKTFNEYKVELLSPNHCS